MYQFNEFILNKVNELSSKIEKPKDSPFSKHVKIPTPKSKLPPSIENYVMLVTPHIPQIS